MIFRMLTVGPYMSNCYIVGSETTKEGMIIDPGAEPQAVLNAIAQLGLNINLVVCTHGHTDHVGAVQQMIEYQTARMPQVRMDTFVDGPDTEITTLALAG